ncbi:MAG: hypothetical protein ACTS41_02000 [Candidatus Hodgkinia cicadicola]
MSSFRPFGGLSASFFEQSSPSDRLIPQNPINFTLRRSIFAA